jgi:lipopolysaccharide/colanic/teichoic acid biosynthesis glycosyltransferase
MGERGYRSAKRACDVVVAAAGLVVATPIMAAVAAAVRSSMGPPVLFRQLRAGRGGVPFELLKVRTMRALRAGEDPYESDGDRLTPLGRRLRTWSLDELPQLVNVLRGDMSLVGPRPLPLAYVDRYSDEQRRRLLVRPGITGWAQVNGRNAVEWDDRFRLDLWYVDHASLSLDLRILGRTLRQVLRGGEVSAAGHATMPEFRGLGGPL